MPGSTDVAAFLEAHEPSILAAAAGAVRQQQLPHYEAAGPVEVDDRLARLFGVLVGVSRERDLAPAFEYAEALAGERHQSGYELGEVQRVINSLEEAVWSTVTTDLPDGEQAYALGLVSTVLGAVKDRLACTYVAGFSAPPTTLRLDYLFAEGHPGAT